MQINKRLLLIGALMPIVYFFVLFGAGLLNPEFSHITQAPSELGADGAPYQWIVAFNTGLIIVGILGILGGLGIFMGLGKLGFGKIFKTIASLTIIMPSINMVLSGVFPLPDPNHSLLEVLFPVFFAPLFAALILRRISDLKIPVIILIIGFILNIAIFAGIIGIGGFVTDDNFGLWIRLWALIVMPATGYMCWMVRAKL